MLLLSTLEMTYLLCSSALHRPNLFPLFANDPRCGTERVQGFRTWIRNQTCCARREEEGSRREGSAGPKLSVPACRKRGVATTSLSKRASAQNER
jgi:hypothetical protein